MRLFMTAIILTMLTHAAWAEQWPSSRCQQIEERAAEAWGQYFISDLLLRSKLDANDINDANRDEREKIASQYQKTQMDLGDAYKIAQVYQAFCKP